MKFLPLIWAGLRRTPTRSILTVLSIVAAFTLFGLLQSVNALFDYQIAAARLDRLIVRPWTTGPLPLAYRDQIARLPGVTRVVPVAGLGGTYQSPQNRVGVRLVSEDWFAVADEFDIPPSARAALAATRNAVLVSVKQAQKYGWKVGDTFPLQSPVQRIDNTNVWTFEIVAIVPDVDVAPNGFALGNFSYVDEARATNRGMTGSLMAQIADPARSEELSQRIDDLFASASVPTRTESERLTQEMAWENGVDIKLILTSIVAAVFFMLLFMTSNAVAQSVRERIPEFAVLKTIGFSDGQAFVLVLSEALTLCLLGAVTGMAIASVTMVITAQVLGEGFTVPQLTGWVIFVGASIALATALVSGAQPAWRMKRLPIVDALAGR